MKKMLSVIIAVSLCLAFSSCGGENSSKKDMTIVASVFTLYDFTRSIAGDNARVKMVASPGADIHNYSVDTSDIHDYLNCDLFIYYGNDSDLFANDIISKSDKTDTLKIAESGGDAHIWTSPEKATETAKMICDKLCQKDNINSDEYKSNLNSLLRQLKEIDERFSEISKSANGREIIFEGAFPLKNFAKRYNLKYYSPDLFCTNKPSLVSAGDIVDLINRINENNSKYIFYTEISDCKIADEVCRTAGINKLLLHSCHNVTKSEFDSGITYCKLMNKNADNLQKYFE